MLGFNAPMPGKLNLRSTRTSVSKQKKQKERLGADQIPADKQRLSLKETQAKGSTLSTVYVPTPIRSRDKKRKYDEDSSSSSTSSESFSKSVSRNTFFDDNRSSAVPLNMEVDNVTHLMELERPYTNSERVSSKLYINMAQYSRRVPTAPPFSNVEIQYQLIFDRLSREVKSKVRSATLINSWTYTNFVAAMTTVAQSLSVFYAYDAILSYKSSSTKQDKNWAVMTLAQQLSTESNLLAKDNLRKALKGCWFPPKFSELIRWTYQIYKVNDLDQAVNYMFVPSSNFIRVNTSGDDNNISIDMVDLLNGLTDPDFVNIYSILSDLMPEGRIIGLPLSCSEAVYDSRHFELFSNQSVAVTIGDGITTIHPVTDADPEGIIMYGLCGEPKTASGLPFVLQSLWKNSSVETIDFFRIFRFVKPSFTSNYDIQQNKFKAVMSGDNLYFQPRCREDEAATDETADIHIIEQNPSTLAVSTKVSAITPPFQPVYFTTSTAPLITLRNFMDSLYGLS